MALIKTLASRLGPDGKWIPQQDIEMGPLEEAAFIADRERWAHEMNRPQEMSLQEKVDSLLADPEGGRVSVINAMESHKANLEEWQKKMDEHNTNCNAKWQAYNEEMAKRPPGSKTC